MKIKREALSKMLELLNLFDEVLEEDRFKDIIINDVLNHNEEGNTIYLIGNKTVPEKTIPKLKKIVLLKMKVDQYSKIHPTKSLEYFINISLNFRPRRSSEDWNLPKEKFKQQVRVCLTNANAEFLTL